MRAVTDLHPYQRNAINLTLNSPSAMLMMDVGTGKTVVTLTAIKALRDSCRAYGVLIVAPLRVCQSVWAQEAGEWEHLAGQFQFTQGFGPTLVREHSFRHGRDIWLINYENLSWLCQFLMVEYTAKGRRLPFNMVVFDEVSKMANVSAVRYKAFKQLMKTEEIDRRIGLTATPATNGLTKLFGEYFTIDSGQTFGTSIQRFRLQYFIPSYDGYSWLPRPNTQARLSEKAAPITLVAKAKELLEITNTVVQDVICDIPDELADNYRQLEREYFTELDCGTEIEAFNTAAKSNKCLQFSQGALYREDKSWVDLHNVKLDALTEIVDEMQGQPLLVMYPFVFDRHRIKERIPGAVDVKDYANAADLLADWNAGKIEVLTGHPGSMGHGLNLQYACNHIVWYGLVWDLELYDQGNGRIAERQGQKHNVIIKRILMRRTMDEVVRSVLADKATTQEDFIQAVKQYRQRIAA